MSHENFTKPEKKQYFNREINLRLLQKALFLALDHKARSDSKIPDNQTKLALVLLQEMSLVSGIEIVDWNSLTRAYNKLYIESCPLGHKILDTILEAIQTLEIIKPVRLKLAKVTEIDA